MSATTEDNIRRYPPSDALPLFTLSSPWDQRRECNMCGELKLLDHAVGYYCGFSHDEIGSISTEYRGTEDHPAVVGGMCVCEECHDAFYALSGEEKGR